jgi:EAL domain-containing protein (putative c-di-GMP-specific phosphodiesterase class I)
VELAYQPLLDLASERVVGVEALARWSHPGRGPVPPDVFIPIAEQTGLIRPLTRNLIQKAIAQVGRWRSEGIELTVAVNLSLRALHDPDLLDCVQRALLVNGVPAAALTLELTESAFAHPDALSRLEDLRALGLHLSIDDFGTGYSSLAYLKRLPVSELKIDRALAGDIVTDRRDRQIVWAVVEVAHTLGLRVVVEGIETADVALVAAALGGDIAQGYWISPPLPAADLTGWLLTQAGVS